MRKIDSFTGKYQVQKTLRFKLEPVGATQVNFERMKILESDKQRAADYGSAKRILDCAHRNFIEKTLSSVKLDGLEEYASLYYKHNKTDAEYKMLRETEKKYREAICPTKEQKKKLTSKYLLDYAHSELCNSIEEQKVVEKFKKFTTYFAGYDKNRENMYSSEEKTTAIGYRCINENLPRFLDDCRIIPEVMRELDSAAVKEIQARAMEMFGKEIAEIFTPQAFSDVLTQAKITAFNSVIGGYALSGGEKVQGINELINLHNQTCKKGKRLPLLKPLFNQILSEKQGCSYIPEAFESDDNLIESVREAHERANGFGEIIKALEHLFERLSDFDAAGIFLSSGIGLTNYSKRAVGAWDAIQNEWLSRYDDAHPKRGKNYDEERQKAFARVESLSLAEVADLANSASVQNDDLNDDFKYIEPIPYYISAVKAAVSAVEFTYLDAKDLLSKPYQNKKRLANNEDAVKLIKDYMDAVKTLELLVKPLCGTGKEDNRCEEFYGEFYIYFDNLRKFDRLYDRVRNYLTKKPFSGSKIALTFDIPNLLNGWVDSKTENSDNGTQYCGYLLRKRNGIGEYDYYLGISDNKKLFRRDSTIVPQDKSQYERMDYYQAKSQTIYGSAYKGNYDADKEKMKQVLLYFANTSSNTVFDSFVNSFFQKETATPKGCVLSIENQFPDEYEKLKKNETFLRHNKEIIQTLKETIASMDRICGSKELAAKEYTMFTVLMEDIDKLLKQKSMGYFAISESELEMALNDDVKPLFLFKITNKDLSYSDKKLEGKRKNRGCDNLHTMYFKALMSGEQSVIDLGTGSIFYREKTLPGRNEERPTHEAGQPIKNKNKDNKKTESLFDYPLYKDNRYRIDQFMLHLSVTFNYLADKNLKAKMLNAQICSALKDCEDNYVIGIDRGERNLLYVCVVDGSGRIAEQYSLNEIVNEYAGGKQVVNYHDLLDKKETERAEARVNWTAIENIKELKQGYMSQVVRKICDLVVKYDAVIAMEDLNSGFKNSRKKIEKQVYQNFEKALIEKLNYLADKKANPEEIGGILNAFQLANKFESFRKMEKQNGYIFYIPAWLTSKIDPVTGFVDLLHPKYTNVEEARKLIESLDAIYYDGKLDMFAFELDYGKFPNIVSGGRKKWTVYSNSTRVETRRDPAQNNNFVSTEIVLSEEFKKLFASCGIDYTAGDLKTVLRNQTKKGFYTRFIRLFALTMQMRNSISHSTVDYLISPVMDENGRFYDSRDYEGMENAPLPKNADANGAYHIARKAQWVIRNIQASEVDKLLKADTYISKAEWLEYTQCHG